MLFCDFRNSWQTYIHGSEVSRSFRYICQHFSHGIAEQSLKLMINTKLTLLYTCILRIFSKHFVSVPLHYYSWSLSQHLDILLSLKICIICLLYLKRVSTKFREKRFFESNIIIKYGNTTNKDKLKGSDFDRTTKI